MSFRTKRKKIILMLQEALCAAFIFFACRIFVAHAQDVQSKAWIDSTSYRIGDWIVVHHEVRAPKEMKLVLPSPKDSIGSFDLISQSQPTESEEDGSSVWTKTFTLTQFDSGSFMIPGLVTNYYKTNDTTAYSSSTQPLSVSIKGVELDSTQSFKDIKDVMHVSLTVWDYLLYAGIVIVIAALIFFGYRYYKKRKEKPVEIEHVKPLRPAHELAFEALQQLEEKHLWEKGADKDYQSELTEIIRQYIENRFHAPALEMTSNELIARLIFLGIERALIEELNLVLYCADMTKFAKYHPMPNEHVTAMKTAYHFIDETKLVVDLSSNTDGQMKTLENSTADISESDVKNV